MIDLCLSRCRATAARITCRFLGVVCASGLLHGHAQESKAGRPSLPAGITLGGKPAASATTGTTEPVTKAEPDAAALLTALAMKTNGGDEAAAKALTTRLLSDSGAKADAAFAKEVEEATAPEAARILGLTLLRSRKAEFKDEGLDLLRKAVKEGSVLAMEVMARILIEGDFGQEVAIDDAVALLRKARQLPGAAEAHRMLGDLSMSGTGLPKDAAIAIEYYRQGAEAGSIDSLLALHRLFLAGDPVPIDLAEAERYGRAAAERGGAEAALEMAAFYEQHVESAPNWLQAGEWLRRAAERGSAAGARRLADYYLKTTPGFADPAEGIRLLRVAAGLGDGEACFQIGQAYKEGVNLPLDPVASTAWIRIAGDFGLAQAENAYALNLMNGYGVTSNPVEAAAWFKRAADRGLAEAMLNLATLHEQGVGVAVDQGLALKFYNAAVKAGLDEARPRLAQFLASLPSARRAELERVAEATRE
jgi:TPR repeat protein